MDEEGEEMKVHNIQYVWGLLFNTINRETPRCCQITHRGGCVIVGVAENYDAFTALRKRRCQIS